MPPAKKHKVDHSSIEGKNVFDRGTSAVLPRVSNLPSVSTKEALPQAKLAQTESASRMQTLTAIDESSAHAPSTVPVGCGMDVYIS